MEYQHSIYQYEILIVTRNIHNKQEGAAVHHCSVQTSLSEEEDPAAPVMFRYNRNELGLK